MSKSRIHTVSLKGFRETNEDNSEIILNGDSRNNRMNNIDFYAIFDGHGGAEVSKYVKKHLPGDFIDKRVPYPLSKRYVTMVYDRIQKSLYKQKFAQTCGSTGLVVIIFRRGNKKYVNIINNGDCRCILCRDNFALPLTKDHKPHWPEERLRIEKLGGKIVHDGHDWRIFSLSVSRSFGDLDSVPCVTHRPDLFRYVLDEDDKFIVLGCDGLWDVLSNAAVVNFILSNCYDNTLQRRNINTNINMARLLAEYAIKKGSRDNITITIIFLD
uniref:Protein phosphatase 2C n=1 Tax=Mimivirus LCMiAC01 TaxID=2506608 RepID=A0A481Z0B7_9VIRU|nr:MAG: protein phosphatase 2C [Mimivirus LCMiAC01]